MHIDQTGFMIIMRNKNVDIVDKINLTKPLYI